MNILKKLTLITVLKFSKLIIFKDGVESKILLIIALRETLKFEISKNFKFLQLLNILCIPVTFEISRLDKFNEINSVQD